MFTQSISLMEIKDDFVILINNFCLYVTFLVVHFKFIEMYEHASHYICVCKHYLWHKQFAINTIFSQSN